MGGLATHNQPSFAAGEVSPAMWGHVDLEKFHQGLKLCRNFFILPYGGAASRAGTQMVGRCRNSAMFVRIISFQYNTLQTYVLEFGDFYMRVVMNGGLVLEPALTIIGATQANPGVFNVALHGLAVGDWVSLAGLTNGMAALNSTAGKLYIVGTVPDAGHITLTDLDGNVVNTAALTPTGAGATVARVYTLATPYAAADLELLKVTQSNDTMTLFHPGYAPQNLTRIQHWSWTLSGITFQAAVQPPTAATATPTAAGTGALDFWYVVTSLTDNPAEESIPTAAFKGTSDALNQNTGVNINAAFTAPATGPAPNRYNVYRSAPVKAGSPAPTVFGYIGQSTNAQFVDANFAPDWTQAPPSHTNPFASSNNPGCGTYFEGRKLYGGSAQLPQNVWLSQPGNYNNMDVRSPSQDDDAITITLASRQVNAVKHLVAMNALLALTGSGAWMIGPGGTSDSLTPTSITAKPQAYNGCSDVEPLTVGTDILYVQDRGSKVRDLSWNFYVNLFTGTDMSVLANHLFFGFQITEWCYAEEPFNVIWARRNDGALLSFTYLKEQNVYAWAVSTTGIRDWFMSTASIPEGQENAVYVVVARYIPGVNGGQLVQYIERMHSRNFYVNGVADVTKAWCVDAGLQYSGDPVSTVSGLDHLNGATVAILADGSVSPPQVVVNGAITLPAPASVITVGLPYSCQLATLNIDTGEPSIQGKRKSVSRVSLMVQDTRGLKMGVPSSVANGAAKFYEFKERTAALNWGVAIPLTTGIETLVMPPQYQVNGSILVQQDNPLPATILSIIPTLTVGDDPG